MKSNLKSNCCNAKIRYSNPTPDFIGDKNPLIGTCYCICTKCNKPCDMYIPVRKTWKINPKTRIVPNKKKNQKEKLAKQEIEQIGNA